MSGIYGVISKKEVSGMRFMEQIIIPIPERNGLTRFLLFRTKSSGVRRIYINQ